MSGAVFKKLMAEMRSGGMYVYFSKLPSNGLKPDESQIYRGFTRMAADQSKCKPEMRNQTELQRWG